MIAQAEDFPKKETGALRWVAQGQSEIRVERTPVAGSQVGAGSYVEVAQISAELLNKYPGALCVGTPAAVINGY